MELPGFCGAPAVFRGVFGIGSGFCAGGALRRGFSFCFSGGFLLVVAEFAFWRGDWALAYCSMGFWVISDVS